MKEYSTLNHKSSSTKKAEACRYDTVRNSIYTRIMSEKANINIPLSTQLERFKKTVKK